MSEWYQLPENLARGFVLTIVIAQNYEPIKAGKLVYLSINTFGTVSREDKRLNLIVLILPL